MVKIVKPKLLYCTIVCFGGGVDKPEVLEETTLVYAKYGEDDKITYINVKTGSVLEILDVNKKIAEKNQWYILDQTPLNLNLIEADLDIKNALELLPYIEKYINEQNKKDNVSIENPEEFVNKELSKKFSKPRTGGFVETTY